MQRSPRGRRVIGIALLIGATGLAGLCAFRTAAPAEPMPADPVAYAGLVVIETNAARRAAGRHDLAVNRCATEVAVERAGALRGSAALEHVPLHDAQTRCLDGDGWAGENLSRMAAVPAAVVAAWLDSPAHRSNLVGEQWTEVGVGCVVDEMHGEQRMLCSQVFLGP